MDEQLIRNHRRWLDAEEDERQDDADAAFGAVFRASVERPSVSRDFTARTVDAVGAVTARDARRARRVRRTLVPLGIGTLVVAAYYGAGLAGTALSVVVVGTLDLLVRMVVGVATTMPAGADLWTVVTSLGRVAGSLLTTPAVTATILAIQGIALVALLALRHLLGSDGESFR
jgi:hypothetical protein